MKSGRAPRSVPAKRRLALSPFQQLVLCCVAACPILGASAPATSAQQAPYPLEGFVVTASPTPRSQDALATNVTVLDGVALRTRGFARVQDALRVVSGLTVVQNGSEGSSTSLFLRGGESNYVLVLVDGVQVNQPGGAFDFSSLTLDNVERIEIVRGPQSSLYGSDAVAGVVQIITRGGRGPDRATLGTRMGSFGRQDWSLEASGGSARAGYSVGLARRRTDGTLAFNNKYTNDIASGSFRVSPDEHTRLRFTGRLSRHTYHFPTDGSGNVEDTNSFTYGDESTLGLDVTRSLGRGIQLQATLGTYRLDGGTDDAQDGPADTLGFYASSSLDHVQRTSANVRGSLRASGLVATLGWELEREGQRSFTESSSEYGPSTDRSENVRWNRGYYAHLTGERGLLSFDGGVRLEDNQRFGRLWTWQLGAVAHPGGSGGPTLRGSVGTGIKEPTFYENFATGFARGNPDLAPERARSWEVGLDQTLMGDGLVLRATYFHQDFRDLIQYTLTTPTADAPNFYNVARARARGVELEMRGSAGPVRGSASWTWLGTHVVDPGVDESDGDEFAPGRALLRRPRGSAAADARVRLGGGVSLSGSLSVVGDRSDRDFGTYPATRVTLRGYTLLDLGASWTMRRAGSQVPDVTISVQGKNVLDRGYQEVFDFPGPGRGLYVGVRLGLGARSGPSGS